MHEQTAGLPESGVLIFDRYNRYEEDNLQAWIAGGLQPGGLRLGNLHHDRYWETSRIEEWAAGVLQPAGLRPGNLHHDRFWGRSRLEEWAAGVFHSPSPQ